MSFDYAEIAATAAEILSEFGSAAQLKVVNTGAYNPATGSASTSTAATDVTACVFDYAAHMIDGTRIVTGDKQAYLTAAVTPKPGDVLAWQGVDYRVVTSKPLAPAGVLVLNELQIRK